MKFSQSLTLFLKKCNAKNLSVSTIRFYEYSLKGLFDYAQMRDIFEIEKINELLLVDYIESLRGKYADITIKGKFVSIKAFFSFLAKYDYIDLNVAENLEKPKMAKKIIPSFSRNDVNDILSAYDRNTFVGYRNYVIMNILFSTGIRKSELLRINICDITVDRDYIKIFGKGSKERYVPISDVMRKILMRYLKKRKDYISEHNKSDIPSLFISKDCRKLTSGAVNTIFRDLRDCKKSWSSRVSPHTFRHTFAKFFLLNGGDLFTLQKILGHQDITTTRIYIDLNTNEIKTQNDKYNPLDNQRWQYY